VGNFFTNKHLPGYAPATIFMAPALLVLAHEAFFTVRGRRGGFSHAAGASMWRPSERGKGQKGLAQCGISS
jgi:hypothetical protein